MLRSAASKVMWVGRATVFLVGLAVIGAVTVGLGSAAIAQAQNPPGQQGVFRLATTNTANAVSGLVGSVTQDAMLLVDNNGGGPALDLQVEPGQAPMKVNSRAKVDNLNADTVDGKSDTDFYAAGSKVADSSHADQADNATSADTATNAQNAANANNLDGKDSSEFVSGGGSIFSFVHTSTPENTYLGFTCIDRPDLNNNPNAQLWVTGTGDLRNGHPLAVYKDSTNSYSNTNKQLWCIYNADGADMPGNRQFNVLVRS